MIIQIRGTSGSGKTWVMQQIVEYLAPLSQWEAQYVTGRKKPETYRWGNIYVLGHYESTCGGCDNIGSARSVYELIQRLNQFGGERHILSEGLLLSEDTKWSLQMPDLRVVYLSTRVDKCIEQINSRRREAGNHEPVNEHNTRNRVRVIQRSRGKLREAGVLTRMCSPQQAVNTILGWLIPF